MIRIIVADDHALIRSGLRLAFSDYKELCLVTEATNGDGTLALCRLHNPDILILDLNMPGTNPIELVKTLKETCPRMKIIILTAYDNEIYVRNLYQLGIKGYILKDEATDVVVEAIRTVYCNQTWFSASVFSKISESLLPSEALTKRELEILEFVGAGKTNGEIAEILLLSERTVRYHLENVLQKMQARNRIEAYSLAVQKGWIISGNF